MTNNFKEADDEFQKLMKGYNNKLVTTNGQILPDSDEVKCEENKGLSGYNKKIEEKAKEGEEIIKEIANGVEEIAKEIAKEIIISIELDDEKTKKEDNITSPKHYVTDKGFEVFEVQEAFIHELKGMAASYWCNVVKYILRFQRKNCVEDLKKARYYLDKLIEEEEND